MRRRQLSTLAPALPARITNGPAAHYGWPELWAQAVLRWVTEQSDIEAALAQVPTFEAKPSLERCLEHQARSLAHRTTQLLAAQRKGK